MTEYATLADRSEQAQARSGDLLLDVQGLKTWFHTRDGVVKAVDGVSLHLRHGEILGLVGESGSGKSRSEEHTSELQSLMRISYDVFCLKKKTTAGIEEHI